MKIASALLLTLTWLSSSAAIDPTQAIRASQAAIGRTISDHRFIDQNGQPLAISALRGQPVLVSFIYTSCAFACPTLTTRLKQITEIASETLGASTFTVLVVGLDSANDTPERMREYARARRIDRSNWRFVSAAPATVATFASEVGFQFEPLGGGFDHVAQVTVLDRNGRVYAQAYGAELDAPAIVDPLKRLALGAPAASSPLSQLLRKARLLCTTFDPKTGRYAFDYSLILEIAIGLTLTLGMAAFLIHSWRQR